MAPIDEVLGRLDFQRTRLNAAAESQASEEPEATVVARTLLELVDTTEQLALIVRDHIQKKEVHVGHSLL